MTAVRPYARLPKCVSGYKARRLTAIVLVLFAAADLAVYGLSYSVYADLTKVDRSLLSSGNHTEAPRYAADLGLVPGQGPRTSNCMLLLGVNRSDGYAGLEPARLLDYRDVSALRVSGTQWVTRTRKNESIAGLKRHDGSWLRVPDPLPRARLVAEAKLNLEKFPSLADVDVDRVATVDEAIELEPGVVGNATIKAEEPGQIRLHVDSPSRQLLVLAESYHPGWKATIDGNAAHLYRVYGDYMGCVVGPDQHDVAFSFNPASLRIGKAISLCGLCLWSCALIGCAWSYAPFCGRKEIVMASSASRPKLSETRLSIVLPVYNEAGILPELYASLKSVLEDTGANWELIFVNDGSHDASRGVLDLLADTDSRVQVIHLSRNFGHQAAVHAGLSHARGDAVVLMDSDMQDAPEAIHAFLDRWQAGYDVVYAVRMNRKENACKRMLFAGFHRFMSAIAAPRIPADAGNFGLIDARVVREIIALGERDRYLPGLRSWVGFRQTGVPVERNARYDKTPRVSLRGLWRLAKTAIFSFSAFPLTVFSWLGFSALFVFIALSAFCLYCRIFTDLAVPGWSSALLVASFFGALNAFGISILGEYVIRIYDQVRGRPLFVVDRTRNIERARNIAIADEQEHEEYYADLLSQAAALLDIAGSKESRHGDPARSVNETVGFAIHHADDAE